MNFTLLLQLCRTDLKRLCWLVLGTWAAMIVAALPYLAWDVWLMPHQHGSRIIPAGESTKEAPNLAAGFALCFWLLSVALGWGGISRPGVRPIPRRSLWFGKICCLAVMLWIPQMLVLSCIWWKIGLGVPEIGKALLLCASVFVPLSIAGWLSGWLAGSAKSWFIGFVVSLTCLILCEWGFSLPLRGLDSLANIWGSQVGRVAVASAWGLAGVPALCLFLRHKFRFRPVATLGCFLLGLTAFGSLHSYLPRPQAVDIPEANEAVAAAAAAVQPTVAAETLELTFQYEHGALKVAPALPFTAQHLPDGVFCSWFGNGSTQLWQDNQIVAEAESDAAGTTPPILTRLNFSPEESVAAARALYPMWPNPLPRHGLLLQTMQDRYPLGGLRPTVQELLLDRLTVLSTKLQGCLFQYALVGEFPAEPHQELRFTWQGHRGFLRFGKFSEEAKSASNPNLVTEVEMLVISPQPEMRLSSGKVMSWQLGLLLPRSGAILPVGNMPLHSQGYPLAGGKFSRRVLGFEAPRTTPPEMFADARLIILAPRALGFIERAFRSDPLPIQCHADISGIHDFQILAEQAYKKFKTTTPPNPATATREEAAEWLQSTTAMSMTRADNVKNALAGWGGPHQELLLQIPRKYPRVYESWLQDMAGALPDSQQPRLRSMLAERPGMIELAAKQKWLAQAVPEIEKLLATRQPLHNAQWERLAELDAPSLQPHLLRHFERTWCPVCYRYLRVRRECSKELAGIVERSYVHRGHSLLARFAIDPQFSTNVPNYGYDRNFWPAVDHGMAQALDEAIKLYPALDRGQGYHSGWANALAASIALPANIAADKSKLHSYLAQLRAADCRWDAATRKWHPKSP